jgi:hypothetical protein
VTKVKGFRRVLWLVTMLPDPPRNALIWLVVRIAEVSAKFGRRLL